MMKERGAFPDCFRGLDTTLQLYFQICSIMSTTVGMSTMASCLANGGLNPFTGEKVFSANHVRHVLPIMLMNGMYDFSGQWAYDIGVPAKSGVGGCVFLVIPNVCGIAMWSPRLDDVGNSVRAVQAAAELSKRYAFHNFEVFAGNNATKLDPTMPKGEHKQERLAELLFAASQGDWHALEQQHNAGVDLFEPDYDSRTALHLAAGEGHVAAVQFLIKHAKGKSKKALSARDRWRGTPLSDALNNGHQACARMLQAAKAEKGDRVYEFLSGDGDGSDFDSDDEKDDGTMISSEAPRILFAAANGDLDELITIVAEGMDLELCDYDKRTALHLAASNGQWHRVTTHPLRGFVSARTLVGCVDPPSRLKGSAQLMVQMASNPISVFPRSAASDMLLPLYADVRTFR